MRFLLIGDEFMWTSGAWRLQQEGHDVRVFCAKKEGKEHLNGMVKQVNTLQEGLSWVKKDGYIIREDEKDVSFLRKAGYKCYGGNKFTERIENDRIFEMEVSKKAGVNIPNYHKANNINEAIEYIKKNPDRYALKQMGNAPKTWNYVGKYDDGSDIIDQLEWMKEQPEFKKMGNNLPFMLQEFIEGIEIAVSAFWMYNDWKRDDNGKIFIEINKEHKKEGDRDTGRTTGEMGTVAKFTTTDTRLFEETVKKYTSILRKEASDVCINFDCNCGVTDDGEVYLMEVTPRFGYPICALQEYLLDIDTGDFYADIIDGIQGKIKFKKEWGVITVLGAGQFPDEGNNHEGSFNNQPVRFDFTLEKWNNHIAPFYIKYDKQKKFFRVADYYEYIAGVCYHGNNIMKASEQCVQEMMKIDVRAPHMRFDIGKKFAEEEMKELVKMGYLEKE